MSRSSSIGSGVRGPGGVFQTCVLLLDDCKICLLRKGCIEVACIVELHWTWCSAGQSLLIEVTAAWCERDEREAIVGGKGSRGLTSLM
eukprot:6492773-Amphidinium_carterae.6